MPLRLRVVLTFCSAWVKRYGVVARQAVRNAHHVPVCRFSALVRQRSLLGRGGALRRVNDGGGPGVPSRQWHQPPDSNDSFERLRAWRVSTKLSWEHARPRASLCGMKIGDQIVVDDRVFILRGVDPMGVAARRVYLEDAETGELVTELLARARTLVESEPDQSDD